MKRALFCFAALLCTAAAAIAGTTGKIAGKVTDAKTGEPLFGINVGIVGTKTGGSTNVDGEYFILNIPPGTYTLRASAVGYTPVTVNEVKVMVDQTTRIPFALQPEAVQLSDVLVTASRPIVQKDLTSTTASVSGDEIAVLPLEDVASVVNLQAGVVDGHFRGGRSNEVKYMIDGVSVNDVFSGGSTMQAEINSIAEIQVLSGTFNAEYGEALSGVVNQVTKIGGDTYAGEISGYTGAYLTDRMNLYTMQGQKTFLKFFPSLGGFYSKVNNIQGSVSGPIPGTEGILKFFASGRYINDGGSIYGTRKFNPSDSSNFSDNDPAKWHIGATGDNASVSMNSSKRLSLQGKLQTKIGSGKGIVIQGFYQQNDYRTYDHAFRLNPDGDYTQHQKSLLFNASYTHVFNDATFVDVSVSNYNSRYKEYVFENPLDPRYVNPVRLQDAGANSFLTGGTQNWQFSHTTNTMTSRLDLTWQITQVHQVKTGVEAQLHTLDYQDFQIHIEPTTDYRPTLPMPGAFDFSRYTNHPRQLALYVQDKIELDYLIVNAGIRFDYFQPDAMAIISADSVAALDDRLPPYSGPLFRKARVKSQISPRIGLSYPITERGAVHISYGHFFQIPPFEFLYKNPNLRIPLTGNYPEFIGTTIGNADLEPQRTTMYEIGLQQELTPTVGVTLTGYYKDIRNLLGLEIHTKFNSKKFGEYVNRDYGAVRGITLAFEKRLSDGFGATIDYTYQVAKGDASDPNDDYNKAQASPPIEINKVLVPLGWDRRHSLNATLTLGTPGNFVASFIARAGSGLPYTPSLINQRTGLENSDNRPAFYNVDLYCTKELAFNGFRISIFLKVYNLFDTANELDVFGDTGRAGYTLELTRAQSIPRGANTIEEYYSRPDFFSAPRQVVIGGSVGF